MPHPDIRTGRSMPRGALPPRWSAAGLVIALAALALSAQPARATPQILQQAARQAIVAVIQKQLDAFQGDDAQAAFAIAAPSIQERFGTPEVFLAMVREHYAPVYRPRQVRFLGLEMSAGAILQHVEVIGPEGQRWRAEFQMIKDQRGRWRINGCTLLRLPGNTA